MRTEDPIKRLRQLVAMHQTQAKAAKALGISNSYLSQLLNGTRAISDPILAALGLERVEVTIEKRAG